MCIYISLDTGKVNAPNTDEKLCLILINDYSFSSLGPYL